MTGEIIYFDSKDKRFYKKTVSLFGDAMVEKIGRFKDLVTYTSGDLSGVEFNDFDFKGVDLGMFDFSKAVIPSSTLEKLGLYDDRFNQELKSIINVNDYSNPSGNEVLATYDELPPEVTRRMAIKDTEIRIFYISDIHLDHKIFTRFPGEVTENEVRSFILHIVLELYDDYIRYVGINKSRVLVLGDVSHSFKIVRMFFEIFTDTFGYHIPIVVLGNHELWNYPSKRDDTEPSKRLDACLKDYEELFDELGISFVHNMLYAVDTRQFVRYEELIAATDKEIRDFCNSRGLLILGGIGFSGLDPVHNFESGLYRETLCSREQDMEESRKLSSLHERLNRAVPDIPLLVMTHMHMKSWLESEPNPNWTYISGHTHQNGLVLSDKLVDYHDNQIGYFSNPIHLKSFITSNSYDLFRDYADGIYEISADQYRDFNKGMSIHMTFNRTGRINMLKRDGLYCFIFGNDKEKLYLLDGGRIKKLESNDLSYYYETMQEYSRIVESFISKYREKLKEMSEAVKCFGGDGTIHGLIVDISFFCHLYLNPIDGTITPYYATSIENKTVYRDVPTLLEEHERPLLKGYTDAVGADSKALAVLGMNPTTKRSKTKYYGTDIYSLSLIFRKFQYLTDSRIIREWRPQFLKGSGDTDALALEVLGMRALKEGEI